MHSELKPVKCSPCNQVSAKWILLGKIRSEVHFLPFEALLDLWISGESKLSQVPSSDKVQLTSYIDSLTFGKNYLWESHRSTLDGLFSNLNLFRVAFQVSSVMSEYEGVLMPREPVADFKF